MLLPLVARAARPGRLDGQRLGLACLSDKPRMLYDYFKQLFAQVTNPAIDSIREEVIMSLECYIGPERNLLETTEEHAHRLRVPHPILSNEQLAALKHMDHRGWKHEDDRHHLAAQRRRGRHDEGARPHLRRGRSRRSTTAIRSSCSPIARSAATACRSARCWRRGAVHHHLVRKTKRTRIGIVVEIGRSPRSASSLPARRLRRRCDQSVPRVRGAVASRREGCCSGRKARTIDQAAKARAPGDRSGANGERTTPSPRKITSW